MRSTVVFLANAPTTGATGDREPVTTGGRNDDYSTLVTTRGKLRKKSGNRNLDFGLINSAGDYELICRFSAAINAGIQAGGKVLVDSSTFTIHSWEVVDQIRHWYKFDLAIQEIGAIVPEVNLGPELITNGDFTGNATSWTLGSGWSYNNNNVLFNYASTNGELTQSGGLSDGASYRVSVTIGGTIGSVAIQLHGGTSRVYPAGIGLVSFDGVYIGPGTAGGAKIRIKPTSDFDGTIDNVSVKEIL